MPGGGGIAIWIGSNRKLERASKSTVTNWTSGFGVPAWNQKL